MTDAIDDMNMERGDPLYDHIVTYMVGLISITSLQDKRVRDQIRELPELVIEARIRDHIVFKMDQFRPLLDHLDSSDGPEHVTSDVKYINRYTIWLAEKVISASFEDVIKPVLDRSEILQFFRHVRNGVSHGNRFRIDRASDNATWRGLHISNALNGTEVIPVYITIGDIFYLLHDVNEHLKSI